MESRDDTLSLSSPFSLIRLSKIASKVLSDIRFVEAVQEENDRKVSF